MSRKKTKYNHDTPHKRISLYKLNDIMKEDEEYQTAMAGSWGGLFIFSLLFYFSGFRAATMYPLNGKFTAFIANADRLGIRFNFQYYGICRTDTFFDCPVLQWIMLLASLVFLIGLIYCFVELVKITHVYLKKWRNYELLE